MVKQPIPNVSNEDVRRIAERDFTDHADSVIRRLLNEFDDCGDARLNTRVRLAILKLAVGDPDRFLSSFNHARRDFRDVLSAAEYPAYTKKVSGPGVSADAIRAAVQADWAQYVSWLGRDPGDAT